MTEHPNSRQEDLCREATRGMYRFVHTTVVVERSTLIAEHIEHCPTCRAYEFEIRIRRVVSVRCSDQVPSSLRSRIMRELGCDDPC